MVVSARYWPALGERIALRLGGGGAGPGTTDVPPRQ